MSINHSVYETKQRPYQCTALHVYRMRSTMVLFMESGCEVWVSEGERSEPHIDEFSVKKSVCWSFNTIVPYAHDDPLLFPVFYS